MYIYIYVYSNKDIKGFLFHLQVSSKDSAKNESSASKRLKSFLGTEQDIKHSRKTATDSDAIIVSKSNTKFIYEKLVCSDCHSTPTMKINKQGVFYCDFDVICYTCNKLIGSEKKDVFRVDDNGKIVNYCKKTLGAVYATMLNGKGQKALADFTVGITLKALCKSEYHIYKNFIIDTAERVIQEHFHVVTAKIFDFYSDVLNILPDKDGILNITVIFDGTWKTRGFNSTLGAGILIEAYTNMVIDFEAYSRKCHFCSTWESKLAKKEITEEQFHDCLMTHEKCYSNFPDSAQAMETAAARAMWARSLETRKMRYTVMISDGDTDSWTAVVVMNPYGVEHPIVKKDCVQHVAKRMYRNLKQLTKTQVIETTFSEEDKDEKEKDKEENEQNKKLSKDKRGKAKKTTKKEENTKKDSTTEKSEEEKSKNKTKEKPLIHSFTGRNKLSEVTMECCQFYYAHNIKIHDNVDDMQEGIQSILDHLTSTDENPKHDKCKDWCFWVQYEKRVAQEKKKWADDYVERVKEYNKLDSTSKAFYSKPSYVKFISKIDVPKHSSMNVRLLFGDGSYQLQRVQEVFTRLSNPELLKRCLEKHTQNPNESFHSRIWRMCPKICYFAYPMMLFAIIQNILIYHLGYEFGNLMRLFDIDVTEDMRKHWNSAEKSRKKVTISKQKKKRHGWSLKKGQEKYTKTEGCEKLYSSKYKGGGDLTTKCFFFLSIKCCPLNLQTNNLTY